MQRLYHHLLPVQSWGLSFTCIIFTKLIFPLSSQVKWSNSLTGERTNFACNRDTCFLGDLYPPCRSKSCHNHVHFQKCSVPVKSKGTWTLGSGTRIIIYVKWGNRDVVYARVWNNCCNKGDFLSGLGVRRVLALVWPSNFTNWTNEVRQGLKLKNCYGTKEACSRGVSSWQPGLHGSPDYNWKGQRTLPCQRKGTTAGNCVTKIQVRARPYTAENCYLNKLINQLTVVSIFQIIILVSWANSLLW